MTFFEEFIKVNNCDLSFESILEQRTEDVRLRIIVNKSDNPTDLLVYSQPDSKIETLQIDFENYVTYSVIYDDYTIWDNSEV
ncbi:hypothetical protein [Psychrobacillus sp. NPDC096389]|uniref:hypothetical protein n=1 Tax=Psychrobacillus sp. NPDC096389 TaxID=3364490 RepID=UPI0037FD5C19